MISFESKSYPYLAIAEYYRIDYGEVLEFVDELKNKAYNKYEHLGWKAEVIRRYERMRNDQSSTDNKNN